MSLLLLMGGEAFNPRTLFANNEQGLWLDPSDMTAGKAAWRRNLLSYSEQFDASYWSGNDRITIAADAGVSPNGTTTAESFVPTAVSGTHGIGSFSGVSMIANQAYTASFYAKASGYNFFRLRVYTGTTSLDAYFNLSNGTIETVTAGANASIQSVGSKWYRCSVGFTAATSGSNPFVVQPLVADADNSASFTGDGTSGIFVWGAQLELGSTPSEYQKITDFSTEFKAAFPTHTLYEDSNGVTPCTAAGDQVGLVIDQSRGGLGALGPELVTNGTFDSVTTGWTANNATLAVVSGQLEVTSTITPIINASAPTTTTIGKWYKVTGTMRAAAGNSVAQSCRIRIGNSPVGGTILYSQEVIANGTEATVSAFFAATATTTYVQLEVASLSAWGGVGDKAYFDNISVREVPGNHAYQTSSGARPTLARIPSSGRRNLITYSEDLSNAAWNSIDVSSATRTNANITLNNAEGYGYHRQDGGSFSTTTDHVVTVDVTSDTTVANVPFRLAGTVDVASLVNLTAGQLTRLTFTGYRPFGSSFRIGIDQRDAIVPGGSNATGYTVTFNRIQLETGSTATNYQKVVSTHDVTESGVSDLWHLSFDGSDDSLVTNAVDFSATDEMTVIAGLRKLSDAANACIAELSANLAANDGSFAFFTGTPSVAGGQIHLNSRGTAAANASLAGVSAEIASPVSLVAAGFADISGDSTAMRINGAASGTIGTGDQGSGNYGNYQLFIGRRGGTDFPYNGHLYQLIIRGTTTPTAKLLQAERFTARKTGVSI